MPYGEPVIIAEICANHMGQFELAKKLIMAASAAGAHVAKFQKRHPRECLSVEQYVSPHPNPVHSYGPTYGDHREFLEFSIGQHVDLADFARECGIEYSTSVWDMTSARQVVEYINPSSIKVPSACNNKFDILTYLTEAYKGTIHLSLGMTTREEEDRLHYFFLPYMERVVVYACTSGYPVPYEKLYLCEINRLCQNWQASGAQIGFSGHHLGIAADVAAYTLGSRYIERHFTLDRSWKGTDNAASLLPSELSQLCRDLAGVRLALNSKPEHALDEIEMEQRLKLRGN